MSTIDALENYTHDTERFAVFGFASESDGQNKLALVGGPSFKRMTFTQRDEFVTNMSYLGPHFCNSNIILSPFVNFCNHEAFYITRRTTTAN